MQLFTLYNFASDAITPPGGHDTRLEHKPPEAFYFEGARDFVWLNAHLFTET